jgi:hypothetical protein
MDGKRGKEREREGKRGKERERESKRDAGCEIQRKAILASEEKV